MLSAGHALQALGLTGLCHRQGRSSSEEPSRACQGSSQGLRALQTPRPRLLRHPSLRLGARRTDGVRLSHQAHTPQGSPCGRFFVQATGDVRMAPSSGAGSGQWLQVLGNRVRRPGVGEELLRRGPRSPRNQGGQRAPGGGEVVRVDPRELIVYLFTKRVFGQVKCPF